MSYKLSLEKLLSQVYSLDNLMKTFPARISRIALFISPLLLVLITCQPPAFAFAEATLSSDRPQTIRPETTSGMQAIFQTLNYNWMQFGDGIPIFILESIPTDINSSVSVVAKKHAFFMGLLPMVLLANQEIVEEREEILQILERHKVRDEGIDDKERIKEISKRYGLRGRPLVDHRARERYREDY